MRNPQANNPAAGKAGIARPFAIEHHFPGLPEPGRSDLHKSRFLVSVVEQLGNTGKRKASVWF
jgi:hypothetical protein